NCSCLRSTYDASRSLSTLSLHDALPISHRTPVRIIRTWQVETRPISYEQYKAIEEMVMESRGGAVEFRSSEWDVDAVMVYVVERSEEHTSELQSRENLVCRLLLEKKNNR